MCRRTPPRLLVLLTVVVALSACTVTSPTVVPTKAPSTAGAQATQAKADPTAETPPTEAPASSASEVVLRLDEAELTRAALDALGSVTLSVKTPKGETQSYTGLRLLDLLDTASLEGDTLTLVASDGYEVEVPISALTEECMLSFDEDGTLDAVMPGLDGGTWVRDVVRLTCPAAGDDEIALTLGTTELTMAGLQALEQVEIEADGSSYRGVRILDMVTQGGIQADTLVFRASDGYEAAIDVAQLTEDAILAYQENGGLGIVWPGTDRGAWVRDVVEIRASGAAREAAPMPKPTAVPAADALFTVDDLSVSMSDLKGLEQVTAAIEGNTYTGVRLLDVLALASIDRGKIVMAASDGYEGAAAVEDLTADALLAYNDEGGVDAVIPTLDRGAWVKYIARITTAAAPAAAAAPLPTRPPSAKPGGTQTVVDSLGREVAIPTDVQSVASMRSGITEIICALGQKDKIVAVDEMVKAGSMYGAFIAGVHPDLMQRAAPFAAKDINAEEMLRIGPDLVLHGGYGRIKQAEGLMKQVPDLPVVIAHFETIDAYMDDIRIVAQCVGAEPRAEALIGTLQATLDFVAERVGDISEADKVRVFYGGHDAYHVYTSDTFEHAQIELAGGVNVAEELTGWMPEVSPEQLLVWNPQVIVLLNGAPVEEVLADKRLAGVDAIKNGRVYALPEASWDFSSPRALFCIEWLAAKLYPERFADLDMDAEADAFFQAVFGVNYAGPVLDEGGSTRATTRTVTDMLGRKVAFPYRVERVVTLSPDLTSTVLALGAADRLVGVDTMAPENQGLLRVFPELADIPVVCSFFNVNQESLLAANPDVVLTVAWQRDLDKLVANTGLPIVCVDIDYYREGVGLVAAALGESEGAGELLEYYLYSQERIDGFCMTRSSSPPKVYVAGGKGLLTTFGRESTWHFEITDVGGANVAAGLQGGGSKEVSMEQVLLWDPEVVILDASCPDAVADVYADARWQSVKAVKDKRVFAAPPGLIDTFGRPHLESALARVWLAHKLYGDSLGLDLLEEARAFYGQTLGVSPSDAEIERALGMS